ncbi:aminotransferase class I/II-fold pyridoxal phosphate-dependent enzyme [Cyanobium sp. Aljojuca 7D2]|uniref:pyridoxal phosphate-dependent aminotransferase n=1 Tax=Cyanobium sp. Aljojuca 7D2 TaxID=2823698 RepID=UPI0020CE61E2|nr:aminotransferase class I/II-fold pyridoxal phosphate-dependent enzyme [Cyanobium sp. Aljojuca 7D2]MCP9889975.1 aminotransferase class I/II-fold pyridoxal phosphate-dependent enzyme [Cyanobium sp. Aljojuca 7D2]
MPPSERHGGNLAATATRLGCRPSQLLDASASLVPFGPPWAVRDSLLRVALGLAAGSQLRAYPDRHATGLRAALAQLHGVEPESVLPGNGAAELFTWAARDAAAAGLSVLPQPGFADYPRALDCWGGAWRSLPLPLQGGLGPQLFPAAPAGAVLWLTNPHNPTGALWSRASLEPLLERFTLVIADEAFLPLVPGGEAQSLIPLVRTHPNLVVIRSLTKLWSIAGLRLGYAIAQPERLARWARWRDPWPVNGLAVAVGERLLGDPLAYGLWCHRVQRWTAREGAWLLARLEALPGITPLPSAANFLLIRGDASLVPLRERLECRHRILLRDCRSFDGLGEHWLRIGVQSRQNNRRMIRALRQELGR